jgi:hypothetical protein
MLLCGAVAAAGRSDEPTGDAEGPTAGGRLIWDTSGELDLLGDLWADVPFRVARDTSLFLGIATRTNIRRPTSDLAFELRDLDHFVAAGVRSYPRPFRRLFGSLFVAEWGKSGIDQEGQAHVRFLGFGVETEGFRHNGPRGAPAGFPRRRVEWRAAGGPVVAEQSVDADLAFMGGARFALGSLQGASPFEFDLRVDGLLSGGRFDADISAGPAVAFAVRGGKRARLFAHYLSSNNPLGLGHSGVLLGFEYSGEAGTALEAPQIDGVLGAGGGEGRVAGELKLRFLSPTFGPDLWAAFVIDVNVLTAEETTDLYYLFHVGLERRLKPGVVGVWLYHRSNHQLTEPNDRVTSLNVLEAGLESAAWHRTGRRPVHHRWGEMDYRAAAGLLISSSFGEDRPWHLRAGARWALPLAAKKLAPFLYGLVETGDVDRRIWAAGISPATDLDLQVEYRNDPQYFARDYDVWLFMARYGFQGALD